MNTKLEELISSLEKLVFSLEKTKQTSISPENIEELKNNIIPALKANAKQFPDADDNQIGSWAVSVISVAPWIMQAAHNEETTALLGDEKLKVTELYLSNTVRELFYESINKPTPTPIKSTPRSP